MTINIGAGWIMFIIFMILKLNGVIDWSWWWVSAPLWGPLLIGLLLYFIADTLRRLR